MKALVAYVEYLSRGIPKGAKLIGEKEMVVEEPKRAANLDRGKVVFAENCSVCHATMRVYLSICSASLPWCEQTWCDSEIPMTP